MKYDVLCVGGRNDGERITLTRLDDFRLIVPVRATIPIYDADRIAADNIETEVYMIERFAGGGGELFYVARPYTQTVGQTIRRLLAGYRPSVEGP